MRRGRLSCRRHRDPRPSPPRRLPPTGRAPTARRRRRARRRRAPSDGGSARRPSRDASDDRTAAVVRQRRIPCVRIGERRLGVGLDPLDREPGGASRRATICCAPSSQPSVLRSRTNAETSACSSSLRSADGLPNRALSVRPERHDAETYAARGSSLSRSQPSRVVKTISSRRTPNLPGR